MLNIDKNSPSFPMTILENQKNQEVPTPKVSINQLALNILKNPLEAPEKLTIKSAKQLIPVEIDFENGEEKASIEGNIKSIASQMNDLQEKEDHLGTPLFAHKDNIANLHAGGSKFEIGSLGELGPHHSLQDMMFVGIELANEKVRLNPELDKVIRGRQDFGLPISLHINGKKKDLSDPKALGEALSAEEADIWKKITEEVFAQFIAEKLATQHEGKQKVEEEETVKSSRPSHPVKSKELEFQLGSFAKFLLRVIRQEILRANYLNAQKLAAQKEGFNEKLKEMFQKICELRHEIEQQEVKKGIRRDSIQVEQVKHDALINQIRELYSIVTGSAEYNIGGGMGTEIRVSVIRKGKEEYTVHQESTYSTAPDPKTDADKQPTTPVPSK
jgi:hypothetical protein